MVQQLDALKGAVSDLVEKTKAGDQKTIAAIAGTAAAVGAGALLYRRYVRNAGPKTGPLTPDTLPAGAYDAVIVGAGPSGSVCANYAVQGGAKVALLDKATFPRGAAADRGVRAGAGPLGRLRAPPFRPEACRGILAN
jgi:NADPH-dependent 2,4-dienoyl-CoA reductase/sulfur reductase-like enzyme